MVELVLHKLLFSYYYCLSCKACESSLFSFRALISDPLLSSEPQGMSFIETSNLDGETNLKIRQASPETIRLDSVEQLSQFTATLTCDAPNRHLYEFNGMLTESNAK